MGLLEELFGDEPWRLLLSTILLNRTRRNQVDRVLSQLLDRWSSPASLICADIDELTDLIAPLGIKHRRGRGLIRFCRDYLELVRRKRKDEGWEQDSENVEDDKDGEMTTPSVHMAEFHFTRQEVLDLYHCGDYCADAYLIFVQRRWATTYPTDHALRAFCEWKQSQVMTTKQ